MRDSRSSRGPYVEASGSLSEREKLHPFKNSCRKLAPERIPQAKFDILSGDSCENQAFPIKGPTRGKIHSRKQFASGFFRINHAKDSFVNLLGFCVPSFRAILPRKYPNPEIPFSSLPSFSPSPCLPHNSSEQRPDLAIHWGE